MGGTRPFVHCAGTLTTWDGVSGVDLVMSIGPAGEVLRLWGNRVDEIRPKVRASLLKGHGRQGARRAVYADSPTWAARAVAPD